MVDRLVFYYSRGHQAHAESGHPERPDRVEAIRKKLAGAGLWERFPHLEPLSIPDEVLHAVHDPAYLGHLQAVCETGGRIDGDTYTTPASWELALETAGGAAAVAGAVWRGEAGSGFMVGRPPGHHAVRARGMGFCLLNNIALAAQYLLQVGGAQRIAIVDLDLHHGNGTQDIFYDRGDVLYISTHQFPHYPGTGHFSETGAGEGAGATVNIPFPPSSGDRAYAAAMQSVILPHLERFQPEMLLVSLGFDAHWRDPLGGLLLTVDGYGALVAGLARWSGDNCGGRLALFLEGGYDLEAGACCALAACQALLGDKWDDPLGPPPETEGTMWETVIAQIVEQQ